MRQRAVRQVGGLTLLRPRPELLLSHYQRLLPSLSQATHAAAGQTDWLLLLLLFHSLSPAVSAAACQLQLPSSSHRTPAPGEPSAPCSSHHALSGLLSVLPLCLHAMCSTALPMSVSVPAASI